MEEVTYFARVNSNNVVEEVIVASQEVIDTFPNSSEWIQTWRDGGSRKNFACIGAKYHPEHDAFEEKNALDVNGSRVLDMETFKWVPSISCPGNESDYYYDDKNKLWVPVEGPPNNGGEETTGLIIDENGNVVGLEE